MSNGETALQALGTITDRGWLVGGALRDRLLGRPTADYDVAIEDEPGPVAQALAKSADGHAFMLSEGFGCWRVVARDRTWQIDLLPLAGETIEADLRKRDLTVNALAEPLGGGPHVDPFGGLEDLRSGRLRMVSPSAFESDALRTLRLARLAGELGFSVEPETAIFARRSAPALAAVAPERIFAELKRIVAGPTVLRGLELMDERGVTSAVLPELTELRGVEQSRYHHLDVYEHTRAVVAEAVALEQDPEPSFGAQAAAVRRLLAEPFAHELTRGHALRFGALFHDIAKPRTRATTAEGRVTFMGHDAAGAGMARAVLVRLRASERLADHVAALTRHHLRLGFLVHSMPLTRRQIYGYMRACAPVQADVTLLSVADRLATRGRGSDDAISKHLELARQLLGEALDWAEHPPRPPVRGDRLARVLGIKPGPELGKILAELEAASFAGEVQGPEQAIERARALLSNLPGR